jgi:hypothetical protein
VTPSPRGATAPPRPTVAAYLKRTIAAVGGFIAVIWLVYVVTAVMPGLLLSFGILPRSASGLSGIVAHPLLHANLPHLLHNSIGIALFGTLIHLREERHFWTVTIVGTLLGGLGVWLFGRTALHIGVCIQSVAVWPLPWKNTMGYGWRISCGTHTSTYMAPRMIFSPARLPYEAGASTYSPPA